jgi:hypothetical protein
LKVQKVELAVEKQDMNAFQAQVERRTLQTMTNYEIEVEVDIEV